MNRQLNFSKYGRYGQDVEYLAKQLEIDVDPLSDEVSNEQVEDFEEVFSQLQRQFGFQDDNVLNIQGLVVSLIESRIGRLKTVAGVINSLHLELIRGDQSNQVVWNKVAGVPIEHCPEDYYSREVILYLLLWGEAANQRFMPEFLAFVFAAARKDNFPGRAEGHFLEEIVTPFYDFIRCQQWRSVGTLNGKDHSQIVGYEDVNECFRDLKNLKLKDGTLLMDSSEWYTKIAQIDINGSLKKTFLEKRSSLHVLVNFVKIVLLHVVPFAVLTVLSLGKIIYPQDQLKTIQLAALASSIAPFTCFVSIAFEALIIPWKQLNGWFGGLMTSIALVALQLSFGVEKFLKLPQAAVVVLITVQCIVSFVVVCTCIINPKLRYVQDDPFVAFHAMTNSRRAASIVFWIAILATKYLASYLCVIQPLSYPIEALMADKCTNSLLCQLSTYSTIASMLLLNFVLYNLDMYIFYSLAMSIYGCVLALKKGLGSSRQTINLSSVLYNLHTKLLFSTDVKNLAILWNSFVLEMFRDHHIGVDSCKTMLFKTDQLGEVIYPIKTLPENCSPEALRRVKYLAQSVACQIPLPVKHDEFPQFTVIVPHYNEVILLKLSDIIHDQQEQNLNRICLLDYLKTLYPQEFANFVVEGTTSELSDREVYSLKTIGLPNQSKESVMRLRIWASLRCQTLFRTVSGFQTYANGLTLVHQNQKALHLLVCMQKYAQFGQAQLEEVDFMFEVCPSLQVSYLRSESQDQSTVWYQCLRNIDGLIYEIKLPGQPVLGDGKSDNQNLGLMFARGDFLQLIDSNQDCYLEEGFKLPSLFKEFAQDPSLVVLGTRENIFSQRIGALADVAASKEYTFGTVNQRFSAHLSARLHYGHPDFVKFTFALPRGGISKGQKGLNLNEDIFFGMSAFMRSGKIGYVEYLQCGKGRDLGFNSITSFVHKLGSGMAEQLISREFYHLGQRLPLDRLLTFYYAHPGFHINNVLSMAAIHLFALNLFLVVARSLASKDFDLEACFGWFATSVIAIAVVSIISYTPFMSQLTVEVGVLAALKRFWFQVISFAPLFEVFTTQVYSYSLMTIGLTVGKVDYVASGRGFANHRQPFHKLYSMYSKKAIQSGFRLAMLLIIVSQSNVALFHIIFFGAVAVSLVFAPFLFNPHQFNYVAFMNDYKLALQWLFCMERKAGWSQYIADYRGLFTGVKDTSSNKLVSIKPSLVSLLSHCLLHRGFIAVLTSLTYLHYKESTSKVKFVVHPIALGAFCTIPIILSTLLSTGFGFMSVFVVPILPVPQHARKTIGTMSSVVFKLISLAVCTIWFAGAVVYENWQLSALVILLTASAFSIISLQFILQALSVQPECDGLNIHRVFFTGQWTKMQVSFIYFPQLWLREVLVKSNEALQFAVDFVIIHIILIFLFIPTVVPYSDQVHTKLLFWNFANAEHEYLKEKSLTTSESKARKETTRIYSVVFAVISILMGGILVAFPLIKLPIKYNDEFLSKML